MKGNTLHMDKRPPEINIIGEFKNKEIEKTYFTAYAESSRNIISMILLFVPVGYFLMLMLNFYVMGATPAFTTNILVRLTIVVPCLAAFVYSLKATNIKRLNHVMVVLMLLTCANYQIVVIVNRNTRFDQQAMSFLLMATVIFMVPTRWITCLIVSIANTIIFFINHAIFFEPEPVYNFVQYIVYFSLCIFCSAYFSYNLNLHRRGQFARETHLRLLSNTDTLTKIYNRQYFNEVLSKQVWQAEVNGVFSVVMFDLDDFKALNDNYGHAIGDIVLQETASIVKAHLRSEDVFSRWGGEEFMVLLPQADKDTAEMVAQRLCREIENRFKNEYGITASFGVSVYENGQNAEEILSKADANMYKAKNLGKNRVVV